MDFDPTTNRVQFGLLTEDERAALKSWPHGWEIFHDLKEWWACGLPQWDIGLVYRGLPAPVVTSTWRNIYTETIAAQLYPSRYSANLNAGKDRIAVLRTDTCNGVATAHLEDM